MADPINLSSMSSKRPPAPNSLLAEVLEALPDGIVTLDEAWRITYANRRACEISTIRPEHINSSTHWELYPESVGTPIYSNYQEAMALREERTIEPLFYEPFNAWLSIHVIPIEGGLLLHYSDVTSIQEAEAARAKVSNQLQQVLAATTDGVISIDRDYRIAYMNPRAIQTLSPSGNVLGTMLWDSFPSAVYPGSPYVENYDRAMYQGEEGSFEAYYPEPLNLWLHIVARPAPDGIIVFFRDVTGHKKREQELRESEARYRLLTELSPQSQWTANPEGLVLYANQRFLEYIGKQFVPKTGKEYVACFDPADQARVVEVWTHSVLTGKDYDIEACLIRDSDGASRWWHLRALPLRDDAGNIQQWLGTANDIHESRTAADTLREQYTELDHRRRELETVYNSSPIGMALYDPVDLRILRINNRQCQIFGITREQAIGKTIQELAPGRVIPHELMRRAAAGEQILNHPVEGVLPGNPDYRYFEVNYSPIFAEDGTVQAVASASIEVTHQKLAELALIQSEKLAAVGRMASSIAHEINNPLEAVTNLLFLARSHAILPEIQTFLDLADQELRRVSIIANQTLRFHKQASNPREITATELFATVLSLYEGRLKNSSITVVNRKSTPRAIRCFEGDIRQVLNNLVGNAIDAMSTQTATNRAPSGGNRLILRSRLSTNWSGHDALPRSGITLTVADTGPGIDPATQPRIFEAFFTTKGIAGTGLGLWISKEIMDRHQGALCMKSSQNPASHGTVFTIFLPFDTQPTAASAMLQ